MLPTQNKTLNQDDFKDIMVRFSIEACDDVQDFRDVRYPHLTPTTLLAPPQQQKEYHEKTYNSEDSRVVTHRTTSSPISCVCIEDRTGFAIFSFLWSYVVVMVNAGD